MSRPRPAAVAVSLALGACLCAGRARAQGSAEEGHAQPRWHAGAALLTVSPSALGGLAVGGALQAQRRLARGPWAVSARLSWTHVDVASRDWEISQDEPALALLAGLEARLGAGLVRAQAGADARLVLQDVARPQAPRLEALRVAGVRHSNWTLSPGALVEVSLSLAVAGPWRAELGGGPRLGLLRLNGKSELALGGHCRVGAAYAF